LTDWIIDRRHTGEVSGSKREWPPLILCGGEVESAGSPAVDGVDAELIGRLVEQARTAGRRLDWGRTLPGGVCFALPSSPWFRVLPATAL
jgi:hypothetical protein